MMSIPTYVVNLKTSVHRKAYMQKLLAAYRSLKTEFIEAVDGRQFDDAAMQLAFDQQACLRRNGRYINPGEVGCTLSHRKCYRKLVASTNDYVLILEDDICVIADLNRALNERILAFMQVEVPRILFLSGDYWHWGGTTPVRVFSAVGSYAYFINKAAARLVLQIDKPFSVADDWDLYKSMGIRLYAIHPYVIDANISGLPSDIQQEHWGNLKKMMSLKNVVRSYYTGLIKRILWKTGHFESKIRNDGK